MEKHRYKKGQSIRCRVLRGKSEVSTASADVAFAGTPDIESRFSPDGRHVAWIVSEMESHPNGGGDYDVQQDMRALIGAIAPRIEIVSKAIAPDVVDRAAAALQHAGFAVAHRGDADDIRPKSLVYAAKGFEPEAATIAAAVPGGATVEALTWKPGYEIVVALGATAK